MTRTPHESAGLSWPSLCLILLSALTLNACEDDPKPPTAEITAPDSAVTVGAWSELSGAQSLNPKGEASALTFEWRLISTPLGSEAQLVDDDTMTPDLRPDLPGAYEVALVVRTSDASSPEVYATVEAGPCGAQDPTVTEVRQHPSEPGVGSVIQLYAVAEDPDLSEGCVGEASADERPDVSVGEAPFMVPARAYDLQYQWRLISRPLNSEASLTLTESVTPVLHPDVSGDYHLEVVVTDAQGATSERAVHVVSVSACGEARPELVVNAPESGTSGAPVELSATVTDADEACGRTEQFSYAWRLSALPPGSASALNDATLAAPSFVPDLPGEYVVTAQVTDITGQSSEWTSATISIDTCGTRAPVISSVTAQGLTVAEEAPEAGAMGGSPEAGAMGGSPEAGAMAGAMGGAMGGSPEAGAEPMWDSELIHIGEVVSFSAEVTDPDLEEGCDLNARLDYHWSVVRSPAQSHATLNRADARSPSLTTDAAGEYTVRLVVTDAEGHPSAPVEVDFVVEGCGGNAPEGSLSFAPEAPQAGDLIALSASFSDPDEGCVEGALSYHWRFTSLPAGSAAMLNDPTAITPSFVADVPGDYSLAAVVTDETGRMSEAHLTLSASECGAYEPTIEQVSHEPELLNAGQAVRFNAVVTDRDLEPACGRTEQLSYQWRLSESPAESAATLSLAQTPSATLITDVAGEYEVSLVVTDARGFESAPVSHRVTVGACGLSAPTLSLEASALAPATGEVIAFNAVVSDADNSAPCDEGQSFSYQWAVLEAPAGSASALLNPQAKTPSLNVDVEGAYLIGCVVTDSTGRASSQATIALNVNACGTNAPEVVSVSAEASPRVGLPARLEVVASDSDNDVGCDLTQALTYRWRMLSTPVGSAAQLLNASLSVASFVPDVVGEYEAEVTVTDETGRAASSAVSLTVGECGVRAPVIDALSLTSPDLRVGTPVEASVSVSDADEDEVACGLEQDLSVMWEVVSAPVGSQVSLDDATRLVTSFTPDLPGDYTLRARASDNTGMMSAWQSAQVSINDCGLARPVINNINESAGPYLIGEAVRFEADFSDADLDAACLPSQMHTHHWRLVSAPAGASPTLVGLNNPTLDLTPDLPGEYIVGLMMSDDTGLTSREVTRSVVVDQCGGFAPELTAITSDSLTPEWALNVPVRLSSDAVDPDVRDCGLEGELSYMWALRAAPAGSQARLNDAQLSAPSLTPDMPGEYELSLVVTDSRGQASALRVSFTAADCGLSAPVAAISATSPVTTNISPLAVAVGDVVQFDGRDSSDADEACGVATTLSYHWLLLRVPPASEATLSLPNGLTPWLRADAPGLYRVQLIVSDGEYMSAPVTFEVNAN